MRGLQRSLEQLEARRLLAGNVLVEQDGTLVRITGDQLGNDVSVVVAAIANSSEVSREH